jgi:hypothetical protein
VVPETVEVPSGRMLGLCREIAVAPACRVGEVGLCRVGEVAAATACREGVVVESMPFPASRSLGVGDLQRFDMIYDGNGKSSGLPRGMPLVTRMEELQANMRGIQWHPRECKFLSENAHRTTAQPCVVGLA